MIYVSENKSTICKGDFHPTTLYKGDKKIAGHHIVEEFSGEGSVVLENCYNDKVNDAFVHGKNLLDINKYYGAWANDKGGISIPNSGTLWYLSNASPIKDVFKENTQYTFSCKYNVSESTTTCLAPRIHYTDGTRDSQIIGVTDYISNIGEGTCILTSAAGKTVQSFSFTYGTTSKVFKGELTEMQIEEGATATEYESPLTNAAITAKGKNILDMTQYWVREGYYTDTGGGLNTSSTTSLAIAPIPVKPNTSYTFASNLPLGSIWFATASSLGGQYVISKIQSNKFTTPENCKYIYVSLMNPRKNLLDVSAHYGEYANENGGITLHSGELYSISNYLINVTGIFKENTQYTFSCKYNLVEATTALQPQIIHTDGTRSYVNLNGTMLGEGTISITSAAGKTVSSFSFTYGTNVNTRYECELTEMQIEEGATATEYDSYKDRKSNFKWAILEKGIGDGVYEPYIQPQTILLENGELQGDIPTFKGTTVIETDAGITIDGKYKRQEE